MKDTLLIIDEECLIAQRGEAGVLWREDLFHSLRTVTSYGLYTLVLHAPQLSLAEDNLTYCVKTLEREKIIAERVIASFGELNLDEINFESTRHVTEREGSSGFTSIVFTSWAEAASQLVPPAGLPDRKALVERKTKETSISVEVNLDGTGKADVNTRIPFFDHMLDQIARHGRLDLIVHCDGDIEIDEHHSVEDTAICLGEAVLKALGDKRGIGRYGDATVPMDDVQGQCVLDFSNRPYFVTDVKFSRDMVGSFPTEMVFHFFKSFSDESRSNIHLRVSEGNTHHQVEALFKAFARAIRQAVFRYPGNTDLPSTKGML